MHEKMGKVYITSVKYPNSFNKYAKIKLYRLKYGGELVGILSSKWTENIVWKKYIFSIFKVKYGL